MADIRDTYDALHEKLETPGKEKLSVLQQKIESFVSTSPLEQIGNSITGGASASRNDLQDLLGSIYAERISKDVIIDELTPETQGDKNQKNGIFDKLRTGIKDKLADRFLQQDNSYDSVLMKQKEKIAVQFKPELDELKTLVLTTHTDNSSENQDSSENHNQDQIDWNSQNEGYAEDSKYSPEEKEQIEEIINNAKEYEGTVYKFGGTSKTGIDCSGLRSKALDKEYKENNGRFGRLTAALFDDNAPDVQLQNAERGYYLFREDPDGVKGHSNKKGEKIYHIEMALGKPYEKDGKWYVKTYGSSSDDNVLDANGENTHRNGVGYRIREIKNNHHFAKPPYYAKLVSMQSNSEKEKTA